MDINLLTMMDNLSLAVLSSLDFLVKLMLFVSVKLVILIFYQSSTVTNMV